MAVKFPWKQPPVILVSLVTIVIVINVVIGGFFWEDLKWLAHVNRPITLSDYNFAD